VRKKKGKRSALYRERQKKLNIQLLLDAFSLTIHEATKTVQINTKDLTLKSTAIEIEGKT